MASRYLLGWRRCSQCYDGRRGLYPPAQRVCREPIHRQGEFSESEALTMPLTDDEREQLLNRLLGDELIGAIDTGDADIIKDTMAETLTKIGDIVRKEIWENPDFETRNTADGAGIEMLAWVAAE